MKTGGNRRWSEKASAWRLPRFSLSRRRRPWTADQPKKPSRPAGPAYLATLIVVIAIVVAAFAFHLHVRFEGVRLGYETSAARAERARLLLERRELRLELATLKAPDRVEAEARERLGMEVPDHLRIVPIGDRKPVPAASGGAL